MSTTFQTLNEALAQASTLESTVTNLVTPDPLTLQIVKIHNLKIEHHRLQHQKNSSLLKKGNIHADLADIILSDQINIKMGLPINVGPENNLNKELMAVIAEIEALNKRIQQLEETMQQLDKTIKKLENPVNSLKASMSKVTENTNHTPAFNLNGYQNGYNSSSPSSYSSPNSSNTVGSRKPIIRTAAKIKVLGIKALETPAAAVQTAILEQISESTPRMNEDLPQTKKTSEDNLTPRLNSSTPSNNNAPQQASTIQHRRILRNAKGTKKYPIALDTKIFTGDSKSTYNKKNEDTRFSDYSEVIFTAKSQRLHHMGIMSRPSSATAAAAPQLNLAKSHNNKAHNGGAQSPKHSQTDPQAIQKEIEYLMALPRGIPIKLAQ